MSGGTSSTRPVRSTIPRPVTFHSLPEHQRNSPAYLSPHPLRRPRTPRSSPLAGPSLSSDQANSKGKDDEGDQKPRYRPNRISSIPDMLAPTPSLYDSDSTSLSPPSSSTPSTISLGTIGVIPFPSRPKSSRSSSSGEDEKEKGPDKDKEYIEARNRLPSIAKRLSIISTSSLTTNERGGDDNKANKRRSGFMLHSASTTSLASTSSSRTVRTDKTNHTAPPLPTIPRWALNAMREEAGVANRSMTYGHRRGTSDDPAFSSSLPPLSNQSAPFPPSISRDPGENWMSVTDPIPKFSRLGLKSESVIMPVKKKESLARMKSAGSIRSTKSASALSQSAGARSDSRVTSRTKSVPLSVGSDNVPPLPPFASNISVQGIMKTSEPPSSTVTSPNFTRRSVASRRDSGLTAVDDNRLSSSLTNITHAEHGKKSQDSQRPLSRRNAIKQIFMRITTAPMPASEEKVKSTTIHDPSPMSLVLPPETLMPLDPPSGARFEKRPSSSVLSLSSTRGVSELGYGQGDVCGGKRFKSIKKRWNTVLATVRGR